MRGHASLPRTQRRSRLATTPRGASAAERGEYGTALPGGDGGGAGVLILLGEAELMYPEVYGLSKPITMTVLNLVQIE